MTARVCCSWTPRVCFVDLWWFWWHLLCGYVYNPIIRWYCLPVPFLKRLVPWDLRAHTPLRGQWIMALRYRMWLNVNELLFYIPLRGLILLLSVAFSASYNNCATTRNQFVPISCLTMSTAVDGLPCEYLCTVIWEYLSFVWGCSFNVMMFRIYGETRQDIYGASWKINAVWFSMIFMTGSMWFNL